uniref:Uncharacterized protein n=1 Tax=Sphaerodactylus townsendi TaxID=933632 RepID=A0ACB8F6G0_9SAUR
MTACFWSLKQASAAAFVEEPPTMASSISRGSDKRLCLGVQASSTGPICIVSSPQESLQMTQNQTSNTTSDDDASNRKCTSFAEGKRHLFFFTVPKRMAIGGPFWI